MHVTRLLFDLLGLRMPDRARAWLEERSSALESETPDVSFILATFTAMARHTGRAALALTPADEGRLAEAAITWPVGHWGTDELGRVGWLLAAAQKLDRNARVTLIGTCYDEGDNRERQAVLRALPLLPEPESHLAVAVESTRSHVQPIFEAIACENPYPSRYFPELNFNQLALKAAFLEIELSRIVDLEKRRTRELSRMARDYAGERQAAGRSVPKDLGLLMMP
jgi:hypothetical protein